MTPPEPFTVGQILYRASSFRGVHVHYREYVVYRVTPKGGWITSPGSYARFLTLSELDLAYNYVFEPKHWVANTGRKRYAYPTKEEALTSLKARAASYYGHCKRRLKAAEERHRNLEGDPQEAPALMSLKDLFRRDRL